MAEYVGLRLTYSTTPDTVRDIFIDNIRINFGDRKSDTFFHVTMPCGQTYICEDVKDFPLKSVPCTCGNPSHWFIKYEFLDINLDG